MSQSSGSRSEYEIIVVSCLVNFFFFCFLFFNKLDSQLIKKIGTVQWFRYSPLTQLFKFFNPQLVPLLSPTKTSSSNPTCAGSIPHWSDLYSMFQPSQLLKKKRKKKESRANWLFIKIDKSLELTFEEQLIHHFVFWTNDMSPVYIGVAIMTSIVILKKKFRKQINTLLVMYGYRHDGVGIGGGKLRQKQGGLRKKRQKR